MLDTSQEIQDIQLKIILSKTAEQRAKMGTDMIDFAYSTVRNCILSENPGISKKELSIEMFKRFYADIIPFYELQEIISKWV
jgi:hypothetical protein